MKIRPMSEFREAGLLWYINRVAFHPRGFALALDVDEATGDIKGWGIMGDGSEIWTFKEESDDANFQKIENLFDHMKYHLDDETEAEVVDG